MNQRSHAARAASPHPKPVFCSVGWPRRLVAAAVAAAGLACAGAAHADLPAAAAAYARQSVVWGPCAFSQAVLPTVVECTTLTVPRDWANPGAGPDLKVAISRIRATSAAQRKGVLFTNPGGPGSPGLWVPYLVAALEPRVGAAYDVVGMDPRGVGLGMPGDSTGLFCDIEIEPVLAGNRFDTRDLSPLAVAARERSLKAIADGCARNPLTPYINTWQTAHDMELVRVVLGERTLNYLGFSYGTWLGAKYAALFPASTGKVVLDSNAGWTSQLSDAWQLMPLAFQRRWEQQLVGWITRSPIFAKDVGLTSAQVNSTYELTRAAWIRLTGDPAEGASLDALYRNALYKDPGFIEVAYTLGALKVCLIDRQDWSYSAVEACFNAYGDRVLREFQDLASPQEHAELSVRLSQRSGLLLSAPATAGRDPMAAAVAASRSATGPTVPIFGTYLAVRCGDGGDWGYAGYWLTVARQQPSNYPLAGYAVPLDVCRHWSLPTKKLPNPDASRLGPILTVQSEFDAPTAYEATMRNVAQFAGARLIAVDDAGGHGQYLVSGNSCVNDAVNAYLVDGVVPPARTVCGAVPLLLEDSVYPAAGPMAGQAAPLSARARVLDELKRKGLQDLVSDGLEPRQRR